MILPLVSDDDNIVFLIYFLTLGKNVYYTIFVNICKQARQLVLSKSRNISLVSNFIDAIISKLERF